MGGNDGQDNKTVTEILRKYFILLKDYRYLLNTLDNKKRL